MKTERLSGPDRRLLLRLLAALRGQSLTHLPRAVQRRHRRDGAPERGVGRMESVLGLWLFPRAPNAPDPSGSVVKPPWHSPITTEPKRRRRPGGLGFGTLSTSQPKTAKQVVPSTWYTMTMATGVSSMGALVFHHGAHLKHQRPDDQPFMLGFGMNLHREPLVRRQDPQAAHGS